MFATSLTLSGMPRKPLNDSDKKVNIGVRIAPAVLRALQDIAANEDRTISYIAAKALKEWIERNAKSAARPDGRGKRVT